MVSRMAEQTQKQPLLLALGRGYNGFYCPETRFHLIGVMKPQAIYPSATLSEDVKRGLRGGSLIDVNKILTEEDVAPGKGFTAHVTSGEMKKELAIKQEEQIKADEAKGQEPVAIDNQVGELMSEADLDAATGKVLLAFVDKTDGLTLEGLGLTAKPRVEDLREALKKHFGYITEESAEDTE